MCTKYHKKLGDMFQSCSLERKKAFQKRDTLVCLITALAQINPENQCFDVSFFLSCPPADDPHVCPKLHMSTEPQP